MGLEVGTVGALYDENAFISLNVILRALTELSAIELARACCTAGVFPDKKNVI